MKVQFAILAFAIGFAPIALAKDRNDGLPSDQVDSIKPPHSAPEASTVEKSPKARETSIAEDDGAAPDSGSGLSDETDGDDETRVKARTAPVPVESLGIAPTELPSAKPGPKTREAETRKVRITKIGESATPAAKERKERSESILRADEVPLNLKLPAICLLYTSPSPRDKRQSRMPSSA